MGKPIKNITIVGGGTAGWLAAAFLNRYCTAEDPRKSINITLVESPDIPIVGVGEASLPGMVVLLHQLGITESEFFESTDATFKVAAHFVNWNHDKNGNAIEYLNILNAPPILEGHALADYFVSFDPSRGDSHAGMSYVKSFSPVVPIVTGNLSPRNPEDPEFSGEIGYTYHFDATKLAAFLRNIATRRGVKHIVDNVDSVTLDERGFVASLQLREHDEHKVDFIIDCTGFRGSILQRTLGEPFESYSDYLLNDRAAVIQIPLKDPLNIPPVTRATAFSAGWNFNIPLTTRVGTGYVFSSQFISDDDAIQELLRAYDVRGGEPRIIPIRTGRVRNAWVKNCVGLGLAGGFIEPLEATAIFMTDLAVRWLRRFFPTTDFEPALISAYNRHVHRLYDEVRDLVQLHYHLNNRQDSAYWRAAREGVQLSDRLRDNLQIWRSRTPEDMDLESTFLFGAPVYALLLIAKGFYAEAHLANAPFLNRSVYDRYRQAMRTARARQLKNLVPQGEFLRNGGALLRPKTTSHVSPPFGGFAQPSTKIKLPPFPLKPTKN
ncbi:MAG TPA: tryptophan 7-halogenase [Hyphomicrobium sp.]|nr:tryptophan 7-halogenase [Hyphomicrobium sp.]